MDTTRPPGNWSPSGCRACTHPPRFWSQGHAGAEGSLQGTPGWVVYHWNLVCLHRKPTSYDQVKLWMTIGWHFHVMLVCVALWLPYPILLGWNWLLFQELVTEVMGGGPGDSHLSELSPSKLSEVLMGWRIWGHHQSQRARWGLRSWHQWDYWTE